MLIPIPPGPAPNAEGQRLIAPKLIAASDSSEGPEKTHKARPENGARFRREGYGIWSYNHGISPILVCHTKRAAYFTYE